jgi:hypothetical protein
MAQIGALPNQTLGGSGMALGQRAEQLLQPSAVAAHQQQVRPGRRQRVGHGAPDAAAGAGQQHARVTALHAATPTYARCGSGRPRNTSP